MGYEISNQKDVREMINVEHILHNDNANQGNSLLALIITISFTAIYFPSVTREMLDEFYLNFLCYLCYQVLKL